MKNFSTLFFFSFMMAFMTTQCQPSHTHAEKLLNQLKDHESPYVMVVAHRADWRHAPENSLQAIQNCIDMGVDIVEIDIRKTKDGQLVLMHDATINRMTSGKGKITELTLSELKSYRLKDNQGGSTPLTEHQIPTLEEALLVAKDKILVNLDKVGGIIPEALEILQKTGTLNQVLVKGYAPAKEVTANLNGHEKDFLYMPIISEGTQNKEDYINDHLFQLSPVAFEVIFNKDTKVLEYGNQIKKGGARIWINTLWSSLCGGHEDAKALKDPDANWGWVINKGATIIQTDRPKELIHYLESKGHR